MAYESTTRRKRKLQGRRVPISTYLDPEDFDSLVAEAEANERPLSAELRLAVRKHLGKKKAARA